jgi:hypothetical protein
MIFAHSRKLPKPYIESSLTLHEINIESRLASSV